MFVEQRLYTCAPGQTGEFLRVYEREGRAPQMQHLGQPVGYYISEIGMLNQVTTLWAYGSLDERVERRRALFQNADWNAYLNKARPLLTTQETRILVPAPFFQERQKQKRRGPGRVGRPVYDSDRHRGCGVPRREGKPVRLPHEAGAPARGGGPASNDRTTTGATRSTSHGESSITSSSSLARPEPPTTT